MFAAEFNGVRLRVRAGAYSCFPVLPWWS